MKVVMIGRTQATLLGADGRMPGKAKWSRFERKYIDAGWSGAAKYLLEFCGRLCYESFKMPNKATEDTDAYLGNIIAQGHFSVLEHASVTFYVEGVSRNLSHELIRHRHLSFSELSQRYVDMEDSKFVLPPAMRTYDEIRVLYDNETGTYVDAMEGLMGDGLKLKQAREAARYYLPAGTETKFAVTGNLRAWRDVLGKRDSVFADAEMQLFAKEVKRILFKEFPEVFGDLVETSEGAQPVST